MKTLLQFCQMAELDNDVTNEIILLDKKLSSNLGEQIIDIANTIIDNDTDKLLHDSLVEKAEKLGAEIQINKYKMQMILMVYCLIRLEDKYQQAGINKQIYQITASDIKSRIIECQEVFHTIGMSCARWYFCFMNLSLQRLDEEGLEFEVKPSNFDYDKKQVQIKKGEPVISIHIPNNYKISIEQVIKDLKTSYKYYNFNGRAIYKCQSWLLYKPFEEVFVKGGRIQEFRELFDIIDNIDAPEFEDCFRVFKCEKIENLDSLPTQTRLQQNMKKHLEKGGKTGEGLGVLVFDGDKIIE